MITLPKDFPSVDIPGRVELMTVPGHTATSSWVWWVAGGTVLVLAAGGGWFFWSRAVRRKARRMGTDMDAGFDADPPESPT